MEHRDPKHPGDPADPETAERRRAARLAGLESAEAVAEEAERIYGAALRNTGVVHVLAAWQRDDGPLVTLRSHAGSPRCAHDAFALGLARARADALLTTGEILRREPSLRHELPGPGRLPAGLACWRRQVLGKASAPVLLVMTRSGEMDLDHPAFERAGRCAIYAGRSAAWSLESRAMDRGIELVVAKEPSPSDAVERLRREFGAATVVVEAGPSVSRGLYSLAGDSRAGTEPAAGPVLELAGRVDELMLSVLHRDGLESRFRGPRFLSRGEIEDALGRPVATHRIRTPDGDWELVRYLGG